jgi:DNA primase
VNFEKIYKEIYPKINLEKVLSSYNLNYKEYTGKNGAEFRSSCPFPGHDDLDPSFSINKETGIYQCFVCGGGNFFQFIKKIENLNTYKEVIQLLKNKLGISNSQKDCFEEIKKSLETFEEKEEIKPIIDKPLKEIDLPISEPAEKFLSIAKKRVSLRSIRQWKIRYCEKDKKYNGRLIVPIYFEEKLVSFVARDMLGRAEKWKEMKKQAVKDKLSNEEISRLEKEHGCKKILFPYDSPVSRVFFNWDEAKEHKDEVILCEGVFDAIRVVNFGYNAIALLSCHVNDGRRNLIAKTFDRICISLDNDYKVRDNGTVKNPGQEAAQKLLEKFRDYDV